MRILAEVEPAAHIGIAGGHELHQPHRTRAAGDRPAIEHGVAAAFGAHDGDDPGFRHAERPRRLGDDRPPAPPPIPRLRASRAGRTTPPAARAARLPTASRSEEHTSELQSLMRISYAVFCLKKKNLPNYAQ